MNRLTTAASTPGRPFQIIASRIVPGRFSWWCRPCIRNESPEPMFGDAFGWAESINEAANAADQHAADCPALADANRKAYRGACRPLEFVPSRPTDE